MPQQTRWMTDPEQLLRETKLVERFLDLVQIDSPSDPEKEGCPSTPEQLDVAKYLVEQLQGLGLTSARVDDNGYVYAALEGRADGPTIGLIAHMDTAPAFSGVAVKPQLHKSYDGSPISLENDVVIDPADSPELKECIGDTIITADGTTLLGADDKAGVAEILAMLEYLRAHPEINHTTLAIAFTPDEEIGRGAHKFDIEGFGAKVAYTVDGGFLGEVNSETFSADQAIVRIEGVSVHPGTAKGKMVNAMDWAGVFLTRLPQKETPQETELREGFYHPTDINGTAAEVTIKLILRDFDDGDLADRGDRLEKLVAELKAEEPRLGIDLEIKRQYRNMANWLAKIPQATKHAFAAVEGAGLKVKHDPIRGGTDGSQLTERGLPTPNIFTGGLNFHGPQEWISTRAMGYATCVLVNLVQLWA